MLTVTELGKQYGGQVLFTDASLQFHAGNRYGVVGANGSGKSTFLRILTGEESSSEGEVIIPRKANVGVLEEWGWPVVHLSVHSPYWKDDPAKRARLLQAMRRYAYIYDSNAGSAFERVDPLTDDHAKGFLEFTLSQAPLEFS